MPRLVRFYIRHVLIGFAMAAAFVAMLLWFNVANLWHLITTSDIGPLALFLLVMFNGVVFSGVQFGIAIMRIGAAGGTGGHLDSLRKNKLVLVPAESGDRH